MPVFRAGEHDIIPEDAVRVTRTDATQMQWDLIRNWKPKKDVLPFMACPLVLSSSSVLTAMYINHHFRRKLRLLTYGRIASYLPVVVMPAFFNYIFQNTHISSSILLGDHCPICIQTEAMVIQVGIGIVYPLVMATVGNFYLANRYVTRDIPNALYQKRAFLAYFVKFVNHRGLRIYQLTIGQAILAATCVYLQNYSLELVNKKSSELDQ